MLSLQFDELTTVLGGSGRARTFWNYLREGKHPLYQPITQQWSEKTCNTITNYLDTRPLISTTVTTKTLSPCGTRKYLQSLSDGQSIESVLIPSERYDRTTLCVSTQIGCDRGCAFCLTGTISLFPLSFYQSHVFIISIIQLYYTGTMGLIRNLTADEIISQVVQGVAISREENMPPLRNVGKVIIL